jgi:hypothetical protein
MRRLIRLLLIALGFWLLIGCGGTAGESTADPSGGSTQPGSEPIRRQAECAFPEQMQVGRPATVRFSIFTSGNRPRELPAATEITEPLELPNRPDLEIWVAVTLDVNGQPVSQHVEREFQRLSERSNVWIWQITPTDAQPLTLQPIVNVEYRDASGRVIERQQNVWTQTYTVEDVVGSNYGSVVLSWLGSSVSELISGMLGSLLMAMVVNPTRNFFSQRFGRKP